MGKRRRKNRTHVQAPEKDDIPRSFVIAKGHATKYVQALVADVRRVMAPHTALKLKVRKSNVLKDFVQVAGPLGVTHLLSFSETDVALNLRICRLPRGPTLTFRVQNFCLAKDIVNMQLKPKSPTSQFLHPPLVVLNNFAKDKVAMQLMAKVFQNMFPSINVATLKLKEMQRVVLLNYNAEDDSIDFRHYDISVKPVGVSKSVRSLLKADLPDLSTYEDISEYILREAGYESEVEEAGVELPQTVRGVGNKASQKSAVRLTEFGPRMQLKLLKIEEGLCEGSVLYHGLIKKSDAEIKSIQAKRAARHSLKAKRKAEQAANIAAKERAAEEHKARCNPKQGAAAGGDGDGDSDGDDEMDETTAAAIGAPAESDDDDAEYYRQEVGEEPPEEFIIASRRRKEGAQRGGRGRGHGRGGRGRGRGGSRGGRGGSRGGESTGRPASSSGRGGKAREDRSQGGKKRGPAASSEAMRKRPRRSK